MTPGKPSSPVAKALAKVAGAKADDQAAGTPVPAGAPATATAAGLAAGTPVNAAAAAPPAPKPPPARNGATPAPGSMSPATAAASAFPTAGPVGSVPPSTGAAAGAAGAASAAGAAAAAGAHPTYSSGAPTPSPSTARAAAAAPASTGRRVRLTVARVDPWSVMKISFLVSVAIGIAFVVMVAVLWLILDGMGVFTSVNRTISDVAGANSTFDLMDYIALPRVMSLSVVVGVIDVILLTALSTLGAFLYNVCSSLVGGVQLTLSDD